MITLENLPEQALITSACNEYSQSECSWHWDEVSDGSIRFQVLDACSTEIIKAQTKEVWLRGEHF